MANRNQENVVKNPLAALKSLDYTKLLVDHGEKLALGGAGLLVLFALFFGTQWSRYDGDPKALEEKARKAEQVIAASDWPDEEKASFLASVEGASAPENRVAQLLEPLPLTDPRFAWDKQSPISWKPIPDVPVLTEPKFLALRYPVANSGRIVIDIPLLSSTTKDEEDDEPVAEDEEVTSLVARSPFQRRDGGSAGLGGESYPGGEGSMESSEGFGYRPGSGLSSLEDYYSSTYEGSMGDEGDMGSSDSVAPSGYATHYVAVRMLFPAREQLKEILKARGQVGGVDAESMMGIYDFEIERQQTVAGPQKWSKWEKFELDSTLKLMDLVSDYDQEVVQPSVVNNTITMPLPVPKYGFWGPNADHATHPKLEEYRLKAGERAMLSIVADEFSSYGAGMESSGGLDFGSPEGSSSEYDGMGGPGQRATKGWSSKLKDFRDVVRGVTKTREDREEAYKAAQDRLEKEFGKGAGRRLDLARYTQMGEYFLFRFVDFDLEPGRAYRYRARVILHNPNNGVALDQVAHPSVAEGEYRTTDWSEATEPVVIEPDLEYYVERTAPGTATRPDSATLNVHLWSEALGTWVSQNVIVEPGQPVGGTKPTNATVVNLVENSYEDAPVRFETEDVLADLLTAPDLDDSDEFHSQYLDIPRGGLQIRSPAIVLNERGEMVALDPVSRDASRLDAEKRVEEQNTGFAYLKKAEVDTSLMGDALDAGVMGGGGEMGGNVAYDPYSAFDFEGGGGQGTARRKRPKRGNPLRLGGDVKRELPESGTVGPGGSSGDYEGSLQGGRPGGC